MATSLSYTYSGNRRSSYSYDDNGNVTSDATNSLQSSYNLINLPAQIKSGSTVKANYSYLSDGTKTKALNASSVGYDYAGSFTYSHASNGAKTLESVAFGGGRIRKSGSTYAVDYHITDHLGSVRAIVNASGTVVEQNDYYPFGTRHPNGLTQLAANRWRFGGKEEQDTAFGIAYSDFGARLYDRSAAWTAIDPMAENYYSVSPYVYCDNSPIIYVDPQGADIYRYDDQSGEMILYEENNDPYDQIGLFRKDKKSGEFVLRTKRDGSARTRIDNIEKGILKDGMNLFEDNHISTGMNGSPSLGGIQQFLLDTSNMINKEIGGYFISEKESGVIRYVTIGRINNNTDKHANPGNPYQSFKSIPTFNSSQFDVSVNYHTHLSSFGDDARLKPSSMGIGGGDLGFKERQLKNNPNMKFLIITNPNPFYY